MLVRLFACVCLLGLAACGSGSDNGSSSTAAAASAAPPAAAADVITPSEIFPYLNVKSWSGTVTAEASGTGADSFRKSEFTYSATGDVTLVDESTPTGPHAVWPNPAAAELTDPARAANAFKRWPAHVTYKVHRWGVSESGQKVDETCSGEETQLALVQVMMVPTGSAYWLNVEPPKVEKVQCTGTSELVESGGFSITHVQIDGKVGGPQDPIAGTSDQSMGDIKARITYRLTPR